MSESIEIKLEENVTQNVKTDTSAAFENVNVEPTSLAKISKMRAESFIGIKGRSDSLDIDFLQSSLEDGISYRKQSDASAFYSMSSDRRKDSDASAMSELIRDEEEMMEEEIQRSLAVCDDTQDDGDDDDNDDDYDDVDDKDESSQNKRKNSDLSNIRKDSDPFENLRKLSDTSEVVSALGGTSVFRKLSEGSDVNSLIKIGKDHMDNIGNLEEMKMKNLDAASKDDGGSFLDVFGSKSVAKPAAKPKRVTLNAPLTSALDHLDALGDADDRSQSSLNVNDSAQKNVVESIILGHQRNRAESWGGMSDIGMVDIPNATVALMGGLPDVPRSSPQMFEGIMSPGNNSFASNDKKRKGSADGHGKLDALRKSSHDSASTTSVSVKLSGKSSRDRSESFLGRERFDTWDARDRIDSFLGRDRLDSFLGRDRSDSLFHRDSLESVVGRHRSDSVAMRDRLDSFGGRDRTDSLANLSEVFYRGRDRLDSLASLGEVSMSMSIGDLEDLAGKLDTVINGGDDESSLDLSAASASTIKHGQSSVPASTIQVDSEAVQCAVQAALAATSGGVLDLLKINSTPLKDGSDVVDDTPIISNAKTRGLDGTNLEVLRKDGRVVGGGKRSIKNRKRPLPTNPNLTSVKKLARLDCPSTPMTVKSSDYEAQSSVSGVISMYTDSHDRVQNNNDTPKRKNTTPTHNTDDSNGPKGGQSNHKWEEMFDCLKEYVDDVKLKETKGMSEEEKKKWEWSGNVPTMYKTKDGKALGRWVNNQRSAKSKGTLKDERETRLLSTGLKWSVLTTNAWTDMLEELKLYVKEKTKDGKAWDGNVPTNYKIKTSQRADGTELKDEDKNLGRWINRQRSLFQAGKLKSERKKLLEDIGLKWAVLSTTSWHTMYDALCEYVENKRITDPNSKWDGNVPAGYETEDKKKLGRWVNRQRQAYANKKMKKEFVENLEDLGLKWVAFDSKDQPMTTIQRPPLQSSNSAVVHSNQVLQKPGESQQRPVNNANASIGVAAATYKPSVVQHPNVNSIKIGAKPDVVSSSVLKVQPVSVAGARPLSAGSQVASKTDGKNVSAPLVRSNVQVYKSSTTVKPSANTGTVRPNVIPVTNVPVYRPSNFGRPTPVSNVPVYKPSNFAKLTRPNISSSGTVPVRNPSNFARSNTSSVERPTMSAVLKTTPTGMTTQVNKVMTSSAAPAITKATSSMSTTTGVSRPTTAASAAPVASSSIGQTGVSRPLTSVSTVPVASSSIGPNQALTKGTANTLETTADKKLMTSATTAPATVSSMGKNPAATRATIYNTSATSSGGKSSSSESTAPLTTPNMGQNK
jgi:hypothetical protein